jgi:cysteine desulfurase family protein (TIGR01976 family)
VIRPDIESVRQRFPALRGTGFFDGPAGTQLPASVIDAVAAGLREPTANYGGAFERSRRSTELVEAARDAAAGFLGCEADEVGFGPNMTTLNFALSRVFGRELRAGDEIVVTRLAHDANVAPWVELARDRGVVVRVAGLTDDGWQVDLDDLARQLSSRTRLVAFPWASNAVGTVADVRRIAELAHDAGALAWVDAVHYAPHGPINVVQADVDILLCSAYKFFGPHVGIFYGRRSVLERWQPYKVRPAPDTPLPARFETGTLALELLPGLIAAIEYLGWVGWDAVQSWERALGTRFLDGLPPGYTLYGRDTMDERVSTFAIGHRSRSPHEVAALLALRGIAVWSGKLWSHELMERRDPPDGAVRVGILHYNSADEVDKLLDELARL